MIDAIAHAILYSVPWPVWAILGIIAAGIIYRLYGWKWALIILAAFGGSTALQKARQAGYKDREKREMQNANKAIDRANKARQKADEINADPNNVFKDDGYRRD